MRHIRGNALLCSLAALSILVSEPSSAGTKTPGFVDSTTGDFIPEAALSVTPTISGAYGRLKFDVTINLLEGIPAGFVPICEIGFRPADRHALYEWIVVKAANVNGRLGCTVTTYYEWPGITSGNLQAQIKIRSNHRDFADGKISFYREEELSPVKIIALPKNGITTTIAHTFNY